MLYLIKQEMFKNYHKKSTFVSMIIQVVIMLAMALLSLKYKNIFNGMSLFKENYDATLWIVFVLIFLASNIFLNEYKYGTIKLLISKEFSRTKIYFSKVVFVFIQSIILYLLAIVMTFIINFIFTRVAITSADMKTFFTNIICEFFSTWLIVSLCFLLASIFRSSGLSITISIILYFSASIAANLMFMVIASNKLLRFNPINMLNITNQASDAAYSHATLLPMYAYFIWIPIYVAIFTIVGNYIFAQRNK
ncbi:hypothetical protein AKUA2003_01430 [Apilactobacillus kunkeei]|nr:hypothetical protein AKUA2003_01430 [Apilactobacillus kunkeei]CAI2558017.1 hypothetical protein AKUA1001_01440 [Apilactobacillus kunkeei]CAI2801132.1 hypothetical protein AKUA2002_01430 [Apilactobacillus kunkeei]